MPSQRVHWRGYLQIRGSERAFVELEILRIRELLSISVGHLFPTFNVILDCSFERWTEDTHRANCHGGPGRLMPIANSIKGNTQPTAVCAFKPRRGNLRKHPFSWSPVSSRNQDDHFGFCNFGIFSHERFGWNEWFISNNLLFADQTWRQIYDQRHKFNTGTFAAPAGANRNTPLLGHTHSWKILKPLFKLQSQCSTHLER